MDVGLVGDSVILNIWSISMSAIQVRNLCKSYRNGSVKALDELCIEVPTGSLFGLMGLNGAGKTTLAYILAGLIKKDSGEISIRGQIIDNDDYLYKQHVGFVLDRPLYFDKLTANEYLRFVAEMYGLKNKDINSRVEELVNFFEFPESGTTLIETYSKGMKQKVSLASAIIHKPDILIFDEPFDGIDVASTEKMQGVLIQISNQGRTVLITSHNLEMIEKLCSDCAIIDKGKCIFQSSMQDLVARLKDQGMDEQSSLRELFLKLTDASSVQDLSWL